MREQRDLELTGGGEGGGGGVKEQVAARHFEQNQPSISQHLVCQPHNRNITGMRIRVWYRVWLTLCDVITVVFCSVRDFVEEIEETMDLPPGYVCMYVRMCGYGRENCPQGMCSRPALVT